MIASNTYTPTNATSLLDALGIQSELRGDATVFMQTVGALYWGCQAQQAMLLSNDLIRLDRVCLKDVYIRGAKVNLTAIYGV